MPGLFLTTPGTRVNLVSQRLRIELPPTDGEEERPAVREIPLMDIEEVVLSESVNFTIPALAECFRRSIPVVVTSGADRVLGLCLPPAPHSAARLAQYRASGDPAFGLALASQWVEAKIVNSRRVLQRLAVNRTDADVAAWLERLEDLARKCVRAGALDVLRGYEGAAAGTYFEAYGTFFPDDCPFERRSRRPPHNAANAILSFAYTLMAAEMECAVYAAGLDPAIGFFHETEDRRASLALDLIEPFRAPVADAMALDLISHGTLKSREHFESRDGGVFLDREGRKRFFVAYERRMNREFVSEQTGKRTTLRGEFRNQALVLKRAVLDREPFEPFLMN